MKIVFVGPFGLQPKATMSVRALSLAKALVAKGHQVTVLIPPWDDPQRAGQVWQDEGVQVINVPLPLRAPLLFHILLTRALVRETLALQPDVVHFFKPKAYAGLAHWVLWWLRRIRQVSTRFVLDSDDWEQAWNEVSPYSTAQKRFFTWQEQWGLGHADAITVASRAIQPLATPYAGQTPIFYVPNGQRQTAPPELTPAVEARLTQLDQDDPLPRILLFSRFLEFRLDRIVTLVGLVAAQLPEARWLIVGQGLRGEENVLAAKLQEVGLANSVHFTGWIPAGAFQKYFQAADVAVHPYDDTLINRTKCSVKLIDLLAAGLPVVADAVGQNKEYIETGVSGLLAPPEDDVAFSEAIISLLQQPALREKLGRAAARRIQKKFTWSRLSQRIEEAYR